MDYTITNGGGVQPNAYQCGTKTTWGWGLENFLPKANKFIGIWPTGERFSSLSRLKELKDKWGFSYLFFGYYLDNSKWTRATSAGFSLNKTMINVTGTPDANRYNLIDHYGNAFAYYVGEPADQDHSMGGVRYALNSLNLSSLFVIDGYKRTSDLDDCVNLADQVLFSSYHHWWECFPNVFCDRPPYDPDQRPDWLRMKIDYGNKFTMTWIGAHKDLSDYDELFDQAHALGLNIVWLYQYDDITDAGSDNNVQSFSYAAFGDGYLKQKQRKYRIEWRCDEPNPCENCDPTLPDGWYIDEVFPTAYTRIIEN